jgi:hypothetical protein
VYCHVSHPLTKVQTAAAATTADTAATDDDDDNEGESVGNSEGEDDEDNEDLSGDIMGPKKVPAAVAAAAAPKKAPTKKSGNVDALADLLQGATVTKGVKKPAFTSYSTKVEDPLLIRTVFVDGKQFVEFDMSIAAALLCGDGINAVLASDGMGVSLQRGLYASFFTNRRFQKDLGAKYSKDSSSATAHRKVCDKFKKKESVRNGIVYGECQFVQLPCKCTGLVEEVLSVRVPTPITIPCTVTTKVSGMDISEEEEHIQFMVNKTFRVKTVSQLEKEKKKAVEVTHTGYDIYTDYDSEGTL